MYRFYVSQGQIQDDKICITGPDVNHIKNVLRMKAGEKLVVCNGMGTDFQSRIEQIASDEIKLRIEKKEKAISELDVKITLFQGLPKKDKMDLIVQKAVELGVFEVIPVITKRTVVKIEDKKKEKKKTERWQAIAESAAKQSGRGIVPKIGDIIDFKEAVEMMTKLDYNIIPYENEKGIGQSKKIIHNLSDFHSIGILIGPEGGFEQAEVEEAVKIGAGAVTLGRRILRTETAGIAVLSIIMFESERD